MTAGLVQRPRSGARTRSRRYGPATTPPAQHRADRSGPGALVRKCLRKLGNMGRYLGHLVRHKGPRLEYGEFIRTDFDRRYGVETAAWVPLEQLQTTSPSRASATFYMPSDPQRFTDVVRALKIDPSGFTLIDLGCGKGRMLIAGAECGFRKVIGVELCPMLTERARRNVDAYRGTRRPRTSIEIGCSDAASFTFPPEPLVVFFFNSFRGEVFRKVIENLARSVRETPRDVFFLWNAPSYFPELAEIIQASSPLRVLTRRQDYVIYKA